MRLAAIDVPGEAQPWERLGFAVPDGAIGLGNGAIRLADAVRLVIDCDAGVDHGADLEGVALAVGVPVEPAPHPNGAVSLDHIVLFTDSLERTSAAVVDVLGLPQRRVREAGSVRQAFHRFADTPHARGCIVEVVERPSASTTSIWGIVVNVTDLDTAVAAADRLVGPPKDAVQPGRRIATVDRSAGLPVAVALMSPG